MRLNSFKNLFIEQIQDVYDAETRLLDALPRIANAVGHHELHEAILLHLEETRGHVRRLEDVFAELEMEPRKQTCAAMRGLVQEARDFAGEKGDDAVKDAAIIAALQRIEHYEIAAYGTLKTYAAELNLHLSGELLARTLQEEKAADAKLNELALTVINRDAQFAGQGDASSGKPRPLRRHSRRD